MKTLKFYVVLAMLAFLTFGNTNARDQKVVDVQTVSYCSEDLPCIGEKVCGDLVMITTYWDNKLQIKITGILEGVSSGDLYTAKQIDNVKDVEEKEGNYHFLYTLVMKKKGGPAIVVHYNGYFNIDANGEWTVKFEKYFEQCH